MSLGQIENTKNNPFDISNDSRSSRKIQRDQEKSY